jgi:arylsulfatase A-like enzyme
MVRCDTMTLHDAVYFAACADNPFLRCDSLTTLSPSHHLHLIAPREILAMAYRSMTRRRFLKLAATCAAAAPIAASVDGWRVAGAPTLIRARGDAAKPNIVLVIVDALRADHVSADGYARSVTPNLDGLIAANGVTFRQANTAGPWTFPANAALMTGRLPFRFKATWDNTRLPASEVTLAKVLKQAGYATAGFVSAPYIRATPNGFGQGFDVYDDSVAYTNVLGLNGLAALINQAAQTWLASWPASTQPLFLFLYYFDPHTWYNPPEPYATLYDPSYAGTLTPGLYRNAEDVVGGSIVPSPRDIEHLNALYDGEIAYWDAMFGAMLDDLKSRGLLDNALVMVTADHGDMFGEHGKWTHGNCLYEEVLRIPLLLRYAGVVPGGTAVDTPVQSVDIMPTVLEWLGLGRPANLDGVSLRSLAEGQGGPAHDVFSEIDGISDPRHGFYWLAPRSDLRSIRRGNYKYIHHVGDDASDELYQLGPASPYETSNLIDADAAAAQRLRQAIFERYHLAPQKIDLPLVAR